MRYLVIVLALAINVALVKSQAVSGQAGGSTDGANGDGTGDTGTPPDAAGDGSAGAGGQIGGCSVGASGSAGGSADGSAGGSADGSANGSGSLDCGSAEDGYTYTITATRTENVIPGGHPVLYLWYQVTPTQNMTYFTSVGPSNPLWIEGYIHNGDEVYYSNDENHLLNSCEKQPNGTWQYVLIETVRKSILLGGDCSVDKGNYILDETVDPITVTLLEMIKCGDNNLIFNGYIASDTENSNSKLTWALQLYYSLAIVGTCN